MTTGHFVEDGLYLLEFEGASLLFTVPQQYQSMYSDGSRLPVELPDGSSPLLHRIYIHPFDFKMSDLSHSYPDSLPHTMAVCIHNRQKSIAGQRSGLVVLHMEEDRAGNIDLGMTPQEVVSNIGNPDLCTLNTPGNSDPHSHRYEYTRQGKTDTKK